MTVRNFISIVLGFYGVSATTSNAGMEVFGFILLIAVSLSAIWAFRNKNDSQVIRLHHAGADRYLWLFWLFGVLSAALVEMPSPARLEVILEYRWILLLYSLIAAFVYIKKEIHQRVLHVLFISAGLVAVYAVIQVFAGWDFFRHTPKLDPVFISETEYRYLYRAKGFFRTTMTYSYSFGILFCFLAAYVWGQKAALLNSPKLQRALQMAALIVFASLALTFTRGLWISLLLAVFTMLYLVNRGRALKGALIVAVLAGALYGTVFAFRERISSLTNFGNESSLGRIHLWKANWQMFLDHPLLGVGMGRNELLSREYHHKLLGQDSLVSHAHNNFLQVLSGSGVFGFALYILIFGYFFYQAVSAWKRPGSDALTKSLALGSIGAQIVFHFGGLTECTFADNETLFMFLFLHAGFLAQVKRSSWQPS